MTFENGSRIADYEVIAPLGAGGMGQVYKVRNLISDRVEAMKVLLPDLVNQPDLADRFLHEIKLQANLDHPNIAKLHTALRADNQILMFMEFVEGVSLDRRAREGPVPVDAAVDYISQVLAALDYAHEHGVIHRDIKPANMMLTPGGTVKLMDFGIAKVTTEHGMTATGMTLGSLYYMSPEQIQGTDVDRRSDLYSVGVSLYEMVTGRKPFDGQSQFSIMNAHLQQTPPPPVEIQAGIPPALSELILVSLNRDPAGRFQTAGAFRNALRSVAAAPAVAPAVSPAAAPAVAAPAASTGRAKPRGHRAVWMAAGGLCAVLAIIALIQFGPRKKIRANDAPPPAPQAESPPKPAAAPQDQPAVTPPPIAIAKENVREKPAARHDSPAPAQTAPPTTLAQPLAQPQPRQQQQQQQPPPQQPEPPAPPPVNTQVLQDLRDQWTQLDARAESIRGALQSLQASQSSQGLSLRGDWVQSATLMDTYLRQANSALGSADAAAAKHAMEKAEPQIELLEKALNK